MRIVRWLTQQQWIRFSLRKRLVSMWSKGRDLNIPFEVDFFGLKYAGNLKDYIDRCVYFFGAYEQANLTLLRDLAEKKSKTVFVDIGANVGQHTLWMSQFSESIHAFEPWQPVREKLEQKVRVSNIKNISVYAVGLGDEEGELPFFTPPDSDTGIGSFIESHHEWNKSCGDILPIKVGDAFFLDKRIEPDIIKLDVEGFERNVLQGLQQTLLELKPIVLLEFSPTTKEQFATLQDLLDIFPYPVEIQKIVALGGWKYSLEPFDFNECSDILVKKLGT